ncbi:MAG: RNA polymerase factor sigma-54 [Gammaproteobacteria bacterium]|jgi:RNA polymerase sigma-54 factor|nr:RNA polymerase factor sigma-54 [Gammaproteobacteria bacterium]MBP6051719.1 RNA polymerase factor sigma-54 [Pseudomonadales bacterium]MBK6584728.1 RNA polymerase factor sigma-54 [Gammaproteobacteria bacterium]MBK7519763.1 RNA polymerase factor sigma-54 [Gammaproteobacteria bacterium]MBK7730990.1 RNA polymerase factor sigma-54 [Gammaproteobacteria bacterium]
MKQSLQLKLGQHLTMTPQLQQAIRLLQLSTLELQQEIQEALDSNPLLEFVEHDGVNSAEARVSQDNSTQSQPAESGGPATEAGEAAATDAIPTELAVDTSWDDIYEPVSISGSGESEESRDFESYTAEVSTLADHLKWQLNLTPMSDTDRVIALAIIDGIDNDGMLTVSIEELAEGFAGESGVETDEVLAVLHRLQHFDPVGVAARDLRECLLIQLRLLDQQDAAVRNAHGIVDKYLHLLGGKDYATLMRRLHIGEAELRDAIHCIQQLNPRPGSAVSASTAEYVVPDVIVSKRNGRWLVELNPDIAPRLRINPYYAGLIRRADNSADNVFLRDNLQEAKWFIKSLQSRNETLLKVSSCIVERQQGFLEHGEEAMRPMILHDVATAVNMHESTISRVTTQKYMHTPGGIFELKYFFSSHVSTAAGGECSSVAIRAIIRKLVSAENQRKPLSDSKIAAILEDQGINVARRTIAKYREALGIAPSNERKQLV